MTKTELDAILAAHSLWRCTDWNEGTGANLSEANLSEAV